MYKRFLIILFIVLILNISINYCSIKSIEKECNISDSILDNVKNIIYERLGLNDSYYSNITNYYCGNNYFSLSFIFKNNKSDILKNVINFNLYSNYDYDYDLIFSKEENSKLSWILKQKYITYLINNTDEDFYISLNNYNNCSLLKELYNNSNDEYFNNYYNSCNLIIKKNISDIKELIDKRVDFINYLGNNLSFTFRGYSIGKFNIKDLINNLDCDLVDSNYYYPEFDDDCYGIYKLDKRIYFSINEDNIYLTLYGIIGKKAKIIMNSYNSNLSKIEIQYKVNSILNKYFPELSLNIKKSDNRFYGEKVVNSFKINYSTLKNMDLQKDEMNNYYRMNNCYITISDPYIKIYIPNNKDSDKHLIYPYYSSNYFTITNDKIYSSITLEENNISKAINLLNNKINKYINVNDWSLNLTVGKDYYINPYYKEGIKTEGNEIGNGVNDDFSTNYPDFNNLNDKDSIINKIFNSVKNFIRNFF